MIIGRTTTKPDQCAQVGPRGGQCRRKADAFLDFCPKHNQMVRDGISLRCRKCGGVVSATSIRIEEF